MNLLAKGHLKQTIKRFAFPMIRAVRPAPGLLTKPLSVRWGHDRGTPTGRYFIDRFVEAHRKDISGAVLEVKNRRYADSLGNAVSRAEVLDIDSSNPQATLVADLAKADAIPSNSFDCFILTETLQYIFDLRGAIGHAHRILKPGGILLATVPCTAPIDHELAAIDQWRLTPNSCRALFGEAFGSDRITVEAYGNFVTCQAALAGVVAEELPPEAFSEVSPMFIQGVCIRAVKRAEAG